MPKKRNNYVEWRKPRFNRSTPEVKKLNPSCSVERGRMISRDHGTKWKKPVSKETFDELKEKGVLSKEQINNFETKYGKSYKTDLSSEQIIAAMKEYLREEKNK